jgi:hypothetical protein
MLRFGVITLRSHIPNKMITEEAKNFFFSLITYLSIEGVLHDGVVNENKFSLSIMGYFFSCWSLENNSFVSISHLGTVRK